MNNKEEKIKELEERIKKTIMYLTNLETEPIRDIDGHYLGEHYVLEESELEGLLLILKGEGIANG